MVHFRELQLDVSNNLPARGVLTVPHGLPFTPLAAGVWWTSKNPDIVMDIGVAYPGTDGGMSVIYSVVSTDAQNITIEAFNNDTTPLMTFHYKLTLFMPDDYTGQVTTTQAPLGDYLLNSGDYNYLKVFAEGQVDQDGTTPVVIPHNLGYIPQCRVWIRNYSETGVPIWEPGTTSYWTDGLLVGPKIDSTNLTLGEINEGGTSGMHYYYHIYGDES
jgi:hypothetical protein